MPDVATANNEQIVTLRRFVELTKRKRELDGDVTECKEQLAELEEKIKLYMEQSGIQHMRVDDMTVYMQRKLWASCTNVDVLNGCVDTMWMVQPKVNGQTLSAWVRELPEGEDGLPVLPDSVKDAVNVTETFRVLARK